MCSFGYIFGLTHFNGAKRFLAPRTYTENIGRKNNNSSNKEREKKICSPHAIYYKWKLHYEFRNHWNEFSTRNCWRSTTRLAVGLLCVKFRFENSNDKWAKATIERITNYSNYSNCYYCEASDIFQMVIANGVHTLFEWSWWWTEW